MGRSVAGVPVQEHAAEQARRPRRAHRSGHRTARDARTFACTSPWPSAKYAAPVVGVQPAAARRLPQPFARRPPRATPGYQHLETFIYLNDVSARNGATRLVSRTKTAVIPVEQHTLNLDDYGALYDDPGEAAGPAGSVVAYSPDVYHRSVDVTEPGQARFMLHVAYKPAGLDWVGYQAWPIKGFSPEWHKFVRAGERAAADGARFPQARGSVLDRRDPGGRGRSLPWPGHGSVARRRLRRRRPPTWNAIPASLDNGPASAHMIA